MVKLIFLVLIPFIGIAWTRGGQTREQRALISARAADGKVQISLDGTVRLAGGHPLVESKEDAFRGLTEEGGRFLFGTESHPLEVRVTTSTKAAALSFHLVFHGNQPEDGRHFLGLFFDGIPALRHGVTLWRYGPWKCWSKPILIKGIGEMQSSDIQFFYWQYADGLYGAAVPLSGHGYRTTLGQEKGMFGSKSVSLVNALQVETVPLMSVGFGWDPYELFERMYEEALHQMGREEDLRTHKTFPPILENIGWCTWNASQLGKNLSEEFLLRAAQSFADAKFPIGWFLIDDGWFDQTGNKLNSFEPDRQKFPRGFRPVITALKHDFHLKDVGVWHAFNGYWQGINPSSALGKEYQQDLFSWTERVRPDQETSPLRTCSFIVPASVNRFYETWHRLLREEGFTFVKVDNQLIVERMADGNFAIWEGAELYHRALNASVARTFDNTIINCMDMTPDAYFNFGTTAVARTSEDYFPYEKGETYDLQRGNAAAHVVQATYNALYFSQMVYPDFDHFQSHNPNAVFHAIARAINNGPIYITDEIGQQRYDVLRPLIYSDGAIIRADQALLPTEDCLFQIQNTRPFKAFSRAGATGLLGIWNCADADRVEGTFRPADVHGIQGEHFAVYEYFSRTVTFADRDSAIPLALDRLGYRLYYIVPLVEGSAPIGLIDKYNAPATVLHSAMSATGMRVTVADGGRFAAVTARRPSTVSVDGISAPFTYKDRLVIVQLSLDETRQKRTVEILLE